MEVEYVLYCVLAASGFSWHKALARVSEAPADNRAMSRGTRRATS